MLEAKNAEFSFESFKVPRFSFNERNELEGKLKLGFLPSGRYISKTGDFELTLNFTTHDADDKDKVVFELTALAFFKFSSPIDYEEIPDFFYMNAIAIMFPYIRAFVSTLTLQANTKLLQLSLMNLAELEQPLRSNTTVV